MHRFLISLLAAAATVASAGASAGTPGEELHQRTGFEKGHAGWLYQRAVTGIMWVDKTIGHKAPAIHHTQMFANGSMMFQSRANWLKPVRSGQPFSFHFDAKANVVNYLGSPTRREVVVEFRDYDNPPVDHPYTSVWTIVGYLDAVNLPGWRTWGLNVTDPTSDALPEGWGGYGAEDELGQPFLPEGRTFANVLAEADEIAITTFQPGWAYGSDHDFDVLYDNIEVGVTEQ